MPGVSRVLQALSLLHDEPPIFTVRAIFDVLRFAAALLIAVVAVR